MKAYMDKDFLLETETAKHLFHDYAENQPIVDYHCHISPKEIYENRRFNDLAEVWLGGRNSDGTYFGDHYKWRLMRSHGIAEEYITGSRSGKERIRKFAEALEMAIGNPMYHWCQLELKKYFGIDEPLTPENADEIYEKTAQMLQNDDNLTVRGLILQSNVAMIGTTDDPTDTLEWHEKIAQDETFPVRVCPSFRPDKALNISKEGFAEYIGKLAQCIGRDSLPTFADVKAALLERVSFFHKMGCRASDHGLDYIPYMPASDEEANTAYQKAMRGEALTQSEAEGYTTALLMALGKAYHDSGIVMQIHYGALRNTNSRCFAEMGADTGFDVIAQGVPAAGLIKFMDALDAAGALPKTVLYSLNPVDNEMLGTVIGAFQGTEVPGKIQHGSAWWFNDQRDGMEAQMRSLANLSLLGSFIGMLTDSRSFLSYTRHEYFRRILCNLVGKWVENGEYPNNDASLKKIIEGICSKNAMRYFGL